MAFTISGKLKLEDAIRATLSSLPDEVVDTIGVIALPSEDSISERRRKLEYLKMQEELIKEEKEKEEEELARIKETKARKEDVALKEMTAPTAREAQEQAIARALEKRDQLCEISCALVVLASASSVSREREEFLSLVNNEVDAMLQNLEKEIDDVNAKIGDHWRVLDRDHDRKVSPEEVAVAAQYLKDTLGKEGVQVDNLLMRNKCFNLTI
ncbi:hypothetical protein ES288_D11G269000v1 [Gossypium darwinii]|uniref:EF-hand domain-containing protein n=2 Tax=Gossypium darwinii TaxID=34276 RepID=A0A5D2AR84_GOSDA|nr:hypothetical protein ES288_D11G269000v1 [Gossypium darwinii]